MRKFCYTPCKAGEAWKWYRELPDMLLCGCLIQLFAQQSNEHVYKNVAAEMQNCAQSQGGLHWAAISFSAWPQIVWKEFLTLPPPNSSPHLLFPSQPLRGVNKLHADFLIEQLLSPQPDLTGNNLEDRILNCGDFLLGISSGHWILMD